VGLQKRYECVRSSDCFLCIHILQSCDSVFVLRLSYERLCNLLWMMDNQKFLASFVFWIYAESVKLGSKSEYKLLVA
jgi:hypothetical protein